MAVNTDYGVFATREFKEGETVTKYSTNYVANDKLPLITPTVEQLKYMLARDHGAYFAPDDRESLGHHIRDVKGPILTDYLQKCKTVGHVDRFAANYINYKKEANVGIEEPDGEGKGAVVVALRDIGKNEELKLYYGLCSNIDSVTFDTTVPEIARLACSVWLMAFPVPMSSLGWINGIPACYDVTRGIWKTAKEEKTQLSVMDREKVCSQWLTALGYKATGVVGWIRVCLSVGAYPGWKSTALAPETPTPKETPVQVSGETAHKKRKTSRIEPQK